MRLLSAYKKFAPLLRPLALPYALLMAVRRKCYARGLLSSFLPPCPCVGVGNIAWGGAGKTPFTSWLLHWAGQRGLRAVVLTRGYGGRPGNKPLLVRPDTRPEQSGDEALMLARAFPLASVLAFPRRSESARYASQNLSPDLFILDDGMQHLGMGRHADIVLLRPEDLEDEWNRVIPAGTWREGAGALGAASAFALKATADEFTRLAPLVKKRLSVFKRPVFSFTLAANGLRPLLSEAGTGQVKAPAPENADGNERFNLIRDMRQAKAPTPENEDGTGAPAPENADSAGARGPENADGAGARGPDDRSPFSRLPGTDTRAYRDQFAPEPPQLAGLSICFPASPFRDQFAREPRQTGRHAATDAWAYRDQPYILVSGVGNSAHVEASAREFMGRPPLRHCDFADHHPYTAADVRGIVRLSAGQVQGACSARAAALPVICTAKDAVKLRNFCREWGDTPVWVLETRVRFGPFLFCGEDFPQWWEAWWNEGRPLRKR